jgi:hypothetical protein
MAKYFGTQDIDGLRMQWTQMKCDGCGALGGETAVGHYPGMMALPDGWAGGIENGTLRSYCGECQIDAQMMSNAKLSRAHDELK